MNARHPEHLRLVAYAMESDESLRAGVRSLAPRITRAQLIEVIRDALRLTLDQTSWDNPNAFRRSSELNDELIRITKPARPSRESDVCHQRYLATQAWLRAIRANDRDGIQAAVLELDALDRKVVR